MNRNIVVFDFETTSKNPHSCQITQIAAIALDGRTLKKRGQFESNCKLILDTAEREKLGYGEIEDGALKVTRKKDETPEQQIERLTAAPEEKIVWEKFTQFMDQQNWQGSQFFAPIPAGFNVINYDMHIVNRYARRYGPWDEKNNRQKLYHHIYKVDLMDNIWMWTEADKNVKSISMDSLRDRLGLSKENAHDALQDVKDTANILIKFMKTHRAVYKNLKIDNAFANGELFIQ